MSPGTTRRSPRSGAEITTTRARTKDLLEAFGLYYSTAEENPFGDIVLTCVVCRTTEVIDRRLTSDAGHVLGKLNAAHKVHGPHAQVRR